MDFDSSHKLLAKRAADVQRGAARAAVLGINDGLVSILCLVLGVAGAKASSGDVLLAGFAGLVAGAFSMAAGEWISVKAQVELFGGIIDDISQLVSVERDLMIGHIAEKLSETGLSKETALKSAHEMAGDDGHLLDTYARRVIGFNPEELGSPWVAAFSSFSLFIVGALLPVIPWVLTDGTTAVGLSVGLTITGSLATGAYIGRTSGRSPLRAAIRQFFIVALASIVTYGTGYLFGTVVS